MKIKNIKFINIFLAVYVLFLFEHGCTTKPINIYNPLPFESAVNIAVDKLFTDGQLQLGPLAYVNKPLFVFDQIIDSDSGEATMTSRRIVDFAMIEAKNKYPNIVVEHMNSDNIARATYVVAGVISQDFNKIANHKIPHLYFSLVEAKSGAIASSVDIWIADAGLDFEPTPAYKDSPMYLKDAHVNALIATAKAEAGCFADKQYFDTLATSALLDEASAYYDKGEFAKSLSIYGKAAERADGNTMRTFAGLYQNFMKLNRIEDAKVAFFQLIYLGIKNDNLSIKFLFQVDSTHLFGTKNELNEYAMWIKEIANVLTDTNSCIEIIGHASNSGSVEYNNQLSLKRAKEILYQLTSVNPTIKQHSTAKGKGFSENIVGTGTNDYRDAIDRRVEFKIINCKNLE